jgi:hypothetical protein
MLDYMVFLKNGQLDHLSSNGKTVDIKHFLGDEAWDRVNDIITLADSARQTRWARGYCGMVTNYGYKSFVYDRKVELGLIKED